MKHLKALLATFLATCPISASSSMVECVAPQADGPVRVTADCIDTLYADPVIAEESDETTPVAHRRVSGYFNSTGIEFNIYLPPRSLWEGRFFQKLYPTQDAAASNDNIAFGIESGAYTVQVGASSGYRASAATAKLSRVIARQHYGAAGKRIYGYIHGGSGGSYQTVGAAENTEGIWDGAVTIVQAVPVSIPNVPAVRAFAGLVLGNKSAGVIDAVRPGGSGDPYALLNDVEATMLREATLMGIPLRKWEDFDMVADTRTLDVLTSTVYSLDPDYCRDFWGTPGYLGSEMSDLGNLIRSAVVDVNTSIASVGRSDDGAPMSLKLTDIPLSSDSRGFVVSVYASNETTIQLTGSLNQTMQTFVLDKSHDPAALDALADGLVARVSNRCFIALLPYYRYYRAGRPGFYGWDQFRNSSGLPIYPQRDANIAGLVSQATSGGATHTGKFTGKMIVVDNLWDSDAFPSHADWYHSVVRNATGDELDDKYRIWYNDHADHNEAPPEGVRASYLVDYNGITQQALQYLARWVEHDITPPLSTQYDVVGSQIQVPLSAKDRRGIQPTVQLTANGEALGSSVTVRAGQRVEFKARVEAAPDAGVITSVEWDHIGDGSYTKANFGYPARLLEVDSQFAYQETGTFFSGIRVGTQHDGNTTSSFATAKNIGRMRIYVK